jgi:type II secretory pathway component GspD/PulD (secretin)
VGLLIVATVIVHAQEMKIEVIPLKHRLAKDVIPVLEPLVEKGGTVTGMNDQLIVKTTPANLKQLRKVLDSLDRAARRLRISVRQDVGASLEAREDAISARVHTDEVQAGVRAPHGGGGGISAGDGRNGIRYNTISTRDEDDSFNTHFVTALEGQPAWIQTGRSVPLPSQNVYANPGGVVVQNGIEYRDVNSGFYVVPRLNGREVTLAINPQLNRVDPHGSQVIDTQVAATTVTGRLGQWISIGGSNQDFDRRDSFNIAHTRSRGGETRGIWVKVDELP